jgi:hypothetical protein
VGFDKKAKEHRIVPSGSKPREDEEYIGSILSLLRHEHSADRVLHPFRARIRSGRKSRWR